MWFKSSLQKMLTTLLFILTLLSGCHYHHYPIDSDDFCLKIMEMQRNGVETIQQGSRLLIMIPVDTFFEPLTSHLKPEYIQDIVAVSHYAAQYASFYPQSIVYVRGYANVLFPPYSPALLSQQYATVIAAYLWNAGIPLNNIKPAGYGDHYFIGNPETVPGRGYNRRVEIQIN